MIKIIWGGGKPPPSPPDQRHNCYGLVITFGGVGGDFSETGGLMVVVSGRW